MKKSNISEKAKKPTKRQRVATGLEQPVLGVDGAKIGTISLPRELFAAPMNPQLVSQAVRVYLANQRQGAAATKTRGQVAGSTRKIYRQKGTGRARHGGIRAPIFVGGGIAFGPHPRDYSLRLPQKMRQRALACVLSDALRQGAVRVVDGFETVPGKTKEFVKALGALGTNGKALILTGVHEGHIHRATKNIPTVCTLPAQSVSTYHVLQYPVLILCKDAVQILSEKCITKRV